MKKKYVYTLIFIGILLASLFVMGTGYGLYEATKEKSQLNATTLECFKIYFSDSDTINKSGIRAITNDEGLSTPPSTITVTNICKEEKELQLRLNIMNDNTIDTNAMMITASGNIEQKQILYKNLSNSKTTMENVVSSKLIGLINIKPNETVHTNIKYWFDEKKGINILPEQVFSAKFELIDTASSIKATFGEMLIAQAEDKSVDLFNPATTSEGLIRIKEIEGDSFIYRGLVTNNYVQFAGFKWRIVRVNTDGSVRMILNTSTSYANYSDKFNSQDYTGLQYVYNNELVDNNINIYLANWYNQNIAARKLDKYVTTSIFCNDSNYTVIQYHTYFNGYNRILNDRNASLVCQETIADFGGIYRQKIGLISADEVALAGGVYNIPNYNYYLNNGEDYYTLTPAEYYNYHAYMMSVTSTGAISITPTNGYIGIRPVISLDSTVTVSGSGTEDDPYIVDEE
ncbi:MAG: hypothetical protein ACI4WW_06810 [Candidatus Coprovivens sp.]